MASSDPSSPTTASSRYYNTSDKRGSDLKSHFTMMVIQDFKKNMNNSPKEIQENTGKQVEALKEETQKFP